MPPPMIKTIQPEEVNTFLAQFADNLARKRELAKRAAEVKDTARPPVPQLVDQIRDVLATWPPWMQERISLANLLPLLRGRYRDKPNVVGVAHALRQLGFVSVRSWKTADRNTRFWIKP